MSKQQAILETLLGIAELCGNETIASRIRTQIIGTKGRPQTDGYKRLWSAAFETKRERMKAA